MIDATDGREAADAVERSRRRLAAARDREPKTRRLMVRLRRHLEDNHFADRLNSAFGREDDE